MIIKFEALWSDITETVEYKLWMDEQVQSSIRVRASDPQEMWAATVRYLLEVRNDLPF